MVRVLLDANKDSVIASKCPVCGGYHLDEGDYRFKYDGLDYIKINCNGCMNLVYLILPGTTEVSMDKMAYLEEVIGSDEFVIVPYEEGTCSLVTKDMMEIVDTTYDTTTELMGLIVNNPLLNTSKVTEVHEKLSLLMENCKKLSTLIPNKYSENSELKIGTRLVLSMPVWKPSSDPSMSNGIKVMSKLESIVVDIKDDRYLIYNTKFGLLDLPKQALLVNYNAQVIL